MEAIRKVLENQDKLEPIATDVAARYNYAPDIKAVVFDIYGTLLISASGDVDESSMLTTSIKKALHAAQIVPKENGCKAEDVYWKILDMHTKSIKSEQERLRSKDRPYPEVDILNVCKNTLDKARDEGLLLFNNGTDCRKVVFIFELLSNPVSEMPGLKNTIGEFHRRGTPLGIVSNAQFYTPFILNYYLNGKIENANRVWPFDPEISVFSYKELRGKPDTKLYERLLPVLEQKYGLSPREILYVGNDMLKDVYAARQVGFKTALFAGDKRSLRMRPQDERTKNLEPDFIVTKLEQLLEIVKTDSLKA